MNHRLCLALLIALMLVPGSELYAADRVVLLDGSVIEADVGLIEASGQVVFAQQSRAINLQELRRIERDVQPVAAESGIGLILADRSVMRVQKIMLESGKLTFDWQYGQAVPMSVGSVRAIVFHWKVAADGGLVLDPQMAAALEDGAAKQDAAFVMRDEELTSVRGVVEAIGQDEVTFIWNDKPRKLARKKTIGLVLAPTGPAPDLSGQARAVMADGSSLWGRATGMDGKTLTLKRADLGKVTVDWSAVRGLAVRSDRLVFLSDLSPLRSSSEGIVTLPVWNIQRDRSVMGQALQLGDRTYEKGLGMHANAMQEYAPGAYDLFAATVGIDRGAEGRGDCVFIVKVDGEVKFSARMKGDDEPQSIRIPIKGAAKLELIVEAGEDLDIGDHANWADARLIKEQ